MESGCRGTDNSTPTSSQSTVTKPESVSTRHEFNDTVSVEIGARIETWITKVVSQPPGKDIQICKINTPVHVDVT